jgi:LysR family hydrogen peroxide-inducible transcriptional activator
MEMHLDRYFFAVGRTVNFTRAAAQCGVSKPALTKAIKKPEEELGDHGSGTNAIRLPSPI